MSRAQFSPQTSAFIDELKKDAPDINLEHIYALVLDPSTDLDVAETPKSFTIFQLFLLKYRTLEDDNAQYAHILPRLLPILKAYLARTDKSEVEKTNGRYGQCTIHVIASMNSIEILKTFLRWANEKHVDLNTRSTPGMYDGFWTSALVCAVDNTDDHLKELKVRLWLIAGADPNYCRVMGGETPFSKVVYTYWTLAARKKLSQVGIEEMYKVFKTFIQHGGSFGISELFQAAMLDVREKNPTIKRLWVDLILRHAGHFVNTPNEAGLTPYNLAKCPSIIEAIQEYALAHGIVLSPRKRKSDMERRNERAKRWYRTCTPEPESEDEDLPWNSERASRFGF